MSKVVIKSFDELEKLIGSDLGISDYHEFTQEQINLFADATLDHRGFTLMWKRLKMSLLSEIQLHTVI
jgi:acyl dehydratase